LSDYSSTAFTIYGLAELAGRNHQNAYRFGKLSLLLQEQLHSKHTISSTTAIAIANLIHWYDPLVGSQIRLQEAAMTGLEIGDVVYGSFALSVSYGIHFVLGTNLEYLEKLVISNDEKVQALCPESMSLWTHAGMRVVFNLRCSEITDWSELLKLNSERLDEITFFCQAEDAKHKILVSIGWYAIGTLGFWFGFWSISQVMFQNIKDNNKAFRFGFVGVQVEFFSGIASYARYAQSKKYIHLKAARRHKKTIQKLCSNGYPFSSAYLSILDAESLAVSKSSNPEAVLASYEKSIKSFATLNLHHLEAFANERAGIYLREIDNDDEAYRYFQRALHLYEEKWGATAKCLWLQEKCMGIKTTIDHTFQSDSNILGQLVAIPT
jgi:tetratricopeptide (TPR) repeat protein